MKSKLKTVFCLLSVAIFGLSCGGGGGQSGDAESATFDVDPSGDSASEQEQPSNDAGVASSYLLQQTVFLTDASGIVSETIAIDYDANGNILSETKSTYNTWSVEPDQYVYAYVYTDGALTQWEYSDFTRDHPATDKAVLTHDENGKVASYATYEWIDDSQLWRLDDVTEYAYADTQISATTTSYSEYNDDNVSAEPDTTNVYYTTYLYEDNAVTGGRDLLTTTYFKSTGAVESIGYDLYSCADAALIYECQVTNGNETRFIGDDSCACQETLSYTAYAAYNAVGAEFYELDEHGKIITQRYGVYYLPNDYDDATNFSEYFTSSYFKNLFYDVDFDEEDSWDNQYDPNGAVLKKTVYGDVDSAIDYVIYYRNVYADGTVTTTSDVDGDGIPTEVDLDDSNAEVTLKRVDFCGDGIDNDGDGEVDEDKYSYYVDADGDGYGDPATEVVLCYNSEASAGYVYNHSDCNDADSEVQSASLYTYYADADGDGYGDASSEVSLCYKSSGYAGYTRSNDDDCDDANAANHPSAGDSCDGVDNDCDGAVDEYLATTTYYEDLDGDGYGDATAPVEVCAEASGDYVADATDCDDGNDVIHPEAQDCGQGHVRFPTLWAAGDGVDSDCDGSVDEDRCENTTF